MIIDPTTVRTEDFERAGSVTPQWTFGEKFAFRVLFVYCTLYFFPLPSGLAEPEWLSGIFDPLWQKLAPAIAGLFQVHVTNFSNGSGDTKYDYWRIGIMAALAVIVAIVWSVLDRRRPNYHRLFGWAYLWLRYALAISLVGYGIVKVIKLQFPAPGIGILNETYGESSPMRLLWTFMGFSVPYTFFAGACEMLAGLLLFFRRTATLGALVALAVMTNVALLNFSYDVPVKIGSTHLAFAALLLLLPHARRLSDALFFGRATSPAPDIGPRFSSISLRRAAIAIQVVVVGYVMVLEVGNAISAARESRVQPGSLDGYYMVTSLKQDGVEMPPLVTSSDRWKAFVVRAGYVRVWGLDRSTRLYKIDSTAKDELVLLQVDPNGQPVAKAGAVGRLKLVVAADGRSTLAGTYKEHQIAADMERKDVHDFPLMKRGFHWVNEFPFNQ